MTKTRAQSSTLPGGEAERGPAPIFAPILPPRITKTSHAALVKWRKERWEYEDTICNRAKGDTDDLIVPIKNTFDEGLLREWCRLQWKEIEKIISSVKINSVSDIDQEMAENLRMDFSGSGVHERMIQYLKLCREIFDDHEWRTFFTGLDGTKQLCSILIKSLEPKALREEVDRTARFQVRKAREDEVVLHDLIPEKALDHEKAFQSQRRAKRDRGRGDREPNLASVCTGSKKPRLADATSSIGSQPATKSITDHPKRKTEIRKKLRAQRGEKSKREVARLKRLPECIPNEEKTATLNEVMELPYSADTVYPADHTHGNLPRHVITCRASVNLRVLLSTAAGPVAIHELVECLVISNGEPEFILGQDLLKTLGIDINRQLEQLAERERDDDACLSDNDSAPISTSALTDVNLKEAVEQLVQKALEHGFPKNLSNSSAPLR
ncbi:hypothetical protein F443_12279 [Phytophthora nicotianae P1569]|uniref:Uncharacterized protein n=1 Tax=Phytophthora nicotianae P1569 TaxID=1317065 RepID=V9ETL4_PHYNI|nr:hypothetical protein F443_12279 [Phytophthora nicotianae P1569]